MGNQNINLDGKKMNFIMVVEPESGLPSWGTTMDEFWINMVGHGIADYIFKHQDMCVKANVDNKDSFVLTLNINKFRNAIMGGEVARFKDIVLTLLDLIKRDLKIVDNLYINFMSETTNHFINVYIYGNVLVVGVKLDDSDF